MATVIGKEELCSTDLNFIKNQEFLNGKSLFSLYENMESSIIKKYIDDPYKNFLAHPVVVDNSGKIIFFGKKYNEPPSLLSELQGNDKAIYTKIKDETLAHYKSKIELLKSLGKTDEADFLTNAIKHVDERFVFCYDDIVVLGVWGMLLCETITKDITEIVKKIETVKIRPPKPVISPPKSPIVPPFTISFNAGEYGILNGDSEFKKHNNENINLKEIPEIQAKEGYEFIGWDTDPNGYSVTDNMTFTAQYRERPVPIPVPPPPLPWWKRFWLWLCALFAGRSCLKWLLWLLLLLLLLLLLGWLLRSCEHIIRPKGGKSLVYRDSVWLQQDPRRGYYGGIYDPYNPYRIVPTNPGYIGVLPPNQGVLPPIDDSEIIPGNPSIIANILNILMENEEKSILDLAKDFKTKYPDPRYEVVYYDDVVKRMQIKIPRGERERLKQSIPQQFAPEYELFVFDEALFEGSYTPKDPAFNDPAKSWYLKAINAPQAWDITRGSDQITIAIIDNGFNLKHPELKNKVVQPYNVWKHSNEIFPQQVDHGTYVAGIALAIADNGIGLCGIAPNCKFMPVQVADNRDRMTITSVFDGIIYALYQGADVINVSLGSKFTGLAQFPESIQKDLMHNYFKEEERLWREAMRIAARHNSTIVVAAGNDNVQTGIDAMKRPELFITVTAVDKNSRDFKKADFSNYGQFSTISAPGVDIYSSYSKDGYQIMNGTSAAASIVTGAVALIKSINDTITTKQIICILQNTGLETQGNIGKLIQIDEALKKVKSGEKLDCPDSIYQCNTVVASGGYEGYIGNFQMGRNSGSFVFQYNTETIPDRITIYDGVNTTGKILFKYEGSTEGIIGALVNFNEPTITVEVIGLGAKTYWEFAVNCPN